MVETCYEVMPLEQVSANKKKGGWAGGDRVGDAEIFAGSEQNGQG